MSEIHFVGKTRYGILQRLALKCDALKGTIVSGLEGGKGRSV